MRKAPVKVDEQEVIRRERKAAIPQWLKDLKALPKEQRNAAAKPQFGLSPAAAKMAELVELVLFLLEESPLNE